MAMKHFYLHGVTAVPRKNGRILAPSTLGSKYLSVFGGSFYGSFSPLSPTRVEDRLDEP